MAAKKFLVYLSEVKASGDALNEVRTLIPANAVGYLIEILTFEGIYKKIPMKRSGPDPGKKGLNLWIN